jgi:hypothetical protein
MGKLKVDNENLAKMQEDIEAFLPYFLKKNDVNLSDLSDKQMHYIWFHVYSNLTYPDNHPYVEAIIKDNGGRLLQFNPQRYDDCMYPCGTDDHTLSSALKHIFKNIKEKTNE